MPNCTRGQGYKLILDIAMVAMFTNEATLFADRISRRESFNQVRQMNVALDLFTKGEIWW